MSHVANAQPRQLAFRPRSHPIPGFGLSRDSGQIRLPMQEFCDSCESRGYALIELYPASEVLPNYATTSALLASVRRRAEVGTDSRRLDYSVTPSDLDFCRRTISDIAMSKLAPFETIGEYLHGHHFERRPIRGSKSVHTQLTGPLPGLIVCHHSRAQAL
jgi:hypothetical protein